MTRLLADGSTAGFVELVAGLIAAADPRSAAGAVPSLRELVETFSGVERAETTALLAGFAAMAGDGDLRRRALAELALRRHRLPAWLAGLDQARLSRAAGLVRDPATHEEALLEVSLAGDESLTAVLKVAGVAGGRPRGGAVGGDLGGGTVDGSVLGCSLEELVAVAGVPEVERPGSRTAGAPTEVDQACSAAAGWDAVGVTTGSPGGGRRAGAWWELDPGTVSARIDGALRDWPGEGGPGADHWSAIRPLMAWIARLETGGDGRRRA